MFHNGYRAIMRSKACFGNCKENYFGILFETRSQEIENQLSLKILSENIENNITIIIIIKSLKCLFYGLCWREYMQGLLLFVRFDSSLEKSLSIL